MMITESKEDLLGSRHNIGRSTTSLQAPTDAYLTATEKKFLLYAERGDVATIRRLLQQFQDKPEELDINCVDPLNRSGLIAAIENENIDLIRLLLESNIKVNDALLHAIKEEYVEAVEVLLEWEERIHVQGQPYSWEAVDRSSSTFTPDITPLILAAHMNNYEILKILLDRGATLPSPHDVRCGCDECILSSETDSLRHSQARINAYKALSAPSLIALSARDPLLTAFELSWELRRLSFCETEFRAEYNEMRTATQDFATALLDHARTSGELEVMLNFNQQGEVWEPGERQTLDRLKLAIKYKQKKFVAHPNVQQLLASIWYDGLPGFRRKNMVKQFIEVAKLGCMFPVYSSIYMLAPSSKMGLFMKKPFVKFIFHSSSYAFFLMLLGLASQRAEYLVIEWFGNAWMKEILAGWRKRERGSFPGVVEGAVIIYVVSWIYNEVRALWTGGLLEYIADLWNIVDFITNCFYMIWISLRFTAIFIVMREHWAGEDPYIKREDWHPYDPMLLSEGAFAAGMIFSFLKLVHIFSVNPHLGPLQISLGRMIIDIIKFFFIYTLVLFAFGCGMNQLMWYYADLEKEKCYPDNTDIPNYDDSEKACTVWRRFANLFETLQSLFWTTFGMIDLASFELPKIQSFTRFWAMLMFGFYSVVNIIILLNMLMAKLSGYYQIISERSDIEWKFARSRLWMSYFDEGDTLPAPFNLMPTTKTVVKMFGCRKKRMTGSFRNKSRVKAQERHDTVMRLLVRRYVTAEQRKRDDYGITEDDVIEIRQDISTLRYELIDILRNNGMKTPEAMPDQSAVSKKGKVMERRLIKDFQIGIVEGIVNEALQTENRPRDVFSKIAKAIGKRTSRTGSKKDWNAIVRQNTVRIDPIGSTDERKERHTRQSIRRYIIEKNAALETMDPEKLIDYNPKLSTVTPATRVAYAKFKISKIKQEFAAKEDRVARGYAESLSDGDGLSSATEGDDEVFNKKSPSIELASSSPAAVIPVPSTTSGSSPQHISIVRPRPRSIKNSLSSVIPAGGIARPQQSLGGTGKPITEATSESPSKMESLMSVSSSEEEANRDFRSRTPILEDPAEGISEGRSTPASPEPAEPQATGSDQGLTEETEKSDKERAQTTPEVKVEVQNETKDKKEEQQQEPKERKPLGPTKPGGKSKLTGEILTGWL